MLVSARDSNVKSFIYAASSSTYGDHPSLPKIEGNIGKPLSPYAVTKYVNELYADVFNRSFNLNTIGLRYFNVFGPRQDPNGAYAAVIPKWTASLLNGMPVYINGDGKTSRDFCYIENAVQMNLLAATSQSLEAYGQVYNVALSDSTSLNELFLMLVNLLEKYGVNQSVHPIYRDFRPGDIMHSLADINKAKLMVGYQPTHKIKIGLEIAIPWYHNKWLEESKNEKCCPSQLKPPTLGK